MISRRNKKPVPLHVSQSRIKAERANVILRTQIWIAQLHVSVPAQQNRITVAVSQEQTTHWHCCISTICFCVLLALLNLLFLQWLYYQSVHLKTP
jgi:hypothetical protein